MAATSTLRIAWRNLGRNRKRSLLALGAIGVGQFAFLAVAAFMHGYVDDFYASITGPMVGHIQVHAPEWRDERSLDLVLEDVDSMLDEVRGDPDVVHASARIYAPVLAALSEEGFMGVVVGVDPEAEAHGQGLLPGEEHAKLIGDGSVVVGTGFADRYEIEPGMELAVVGQDVDGSIASALFTVADVVRSPVEVVNNLGIIATLEDAQETFAMYGQAHEIIIHVGEREAIGEALPRVGSLPSVSGYEVMRWEDIVPEIVAMVGMIDGFLIIVLAVVFVAAAAGIANTMLMATFERTHEFGMLLSLGCGPGRISRIIAVEAVLLGLIGVAIGTGLGLLFTGIGAQTGLDYAGLAGNSGESYEVAFKGLQLSSIAYPRLYAKDVAVGVVAVFLTSLVSVIWPIVRVVRLEPMEAMRS
jgi:putative ABC transport system permease protein